MNAQNSPQETDTSSKREPLVRMTGVKKYFPVTRGIVLQRKAGDVHAVDGIDLHIDRGETLGLVGETGCGKSTTARLLMRLMDTTEGKIEFDGQDITHLSRRKMLKYRREMQMVFQDPYTSLNPHRSIGSAIAEPMRIHKTVPSSRLKAEVQSLLEMVGLNPEHYNRYPHEFSGGQRQRVGVARALALRPNLIVCDEPVSALDVSIQAQIINLLKDLQKELNLTYLFIAHDLAVVKHVSDRVAVMYLGKIVEMADGPALYREPRHPYTGALLSAVPVADPSVGATKNRIVLEGDVPSPLDPPSGCRFHPRCFKSRLVSEAEGLGSQPHPRCVQEEPELTAQGPGHVAACHFPLDVPSINPVPEASRSETP